MAVFYFYSTGCCSHKVQLTDCCEIYVVPEMLSWQCQATVILCVKKTPWTVGEAETGQGTSLSKACVQGFLPPGPAPPRQTHRLLGVGTDWLCGPLGPGDTGTSPRGCIQPTARSAKPGPRLPSSCKLPGRRVPGSNAQLCPGHRPLHTAAPDPLVSATGGSQGGRAWWSCSQVWGQDSRGWGWSSAPGWPLGRL